MPLIHFFIGRQSIHEYSVTFISDNRIVKQSKMPVIEEMAQKLGGKML